MKKKLSLLLALLMLASVAALAACSKVEPITVKVVINVAEEDDRGRREVTETILETDFAYESSTPTLNDLLVKLQDAGQIRLVTEVSTTLFPRPMKPKPRWRTTTGMSTSTTAKRRTTASPRQRPSPPTIR